MQQIDENELDRTFSNIIFLIYRNKCIWHNHPISDVPCGGWLETSHLISRANKYYRWDLNNAVPMCKNHHLWWHGRFKGRQSLLDSAVELAVTHVSLSNFMITNKRTSHQYKPDVEALREFLLEHAQEAIEKGTAPFPSLYGKLD